MSLDYVARANTWEERDFMLLTQGLKNHLLQDEDIEEMIVDDALTAWVLRDTSDRYTRMVDNIDRHFAYVRAQVPETLILPPPTLYLRRAASTRHLSFSRGYRGLWIFVSILAMVWGFVAAASLIANVGVENSTAVFGIVATMGLIFTLAIAGRKRNPGRNR